MLKSAALQCACARADAFGLARTRARTQLVILDAKDLSELAEIALDRHVPFRLHGCFVPHQLMEDDEGKPVV